jgi:hypothetical protein
MELNKGKMKYQKLTIGVDQSYTKTGISICADNKLLMVKSIAFKGLKTRTEKRNELRRILTKLISKAAKMAHQVIILCERIRTFSNNGAQRKGFKGKQPQGLNPNYLKMTGALVSVIVDTSFNFDVPVYSVDTRAWKSKIVGSSKARKVKGKRDAKSETVDFIQNLGFNLFIRTNKNGKDIFDDDAADSACIALYGFIDQSQQRLTLEQ